MANKKALRKDIECKVCKKVFLGKQDHGVWQKFCGRDCFKNQKNKRTTKDCETCGNKFLAVMRYRDGVEHRAKHCSKICYSKSAENKIEHTCRICDAKYYLTPSAMRQCEESNCCSTECHKKFYVGDNHRGYNGGKHTTSQTKEQFILSPREGYKGKYRGVHRLNVEAVIGRHLRRGEIVIRIDRNIKNNNIDNLFVCRDNSEFSYRRQGTLEWPDKSNVLYYK
tara:strand:- start:2937 stop:3608 length:672 start_codon:yes stop_codon:yes gene_type:complete